MTTPQDPISTAKGLTEALRGLSERLDAVAARAETTRKWTWRGIIAVAFDLVLSVVTVVALLMAHGNSVSVQQAQLNNVTICRNSNERLMAQKQLWEFLLNKSKVPKNASAKEKATEELLLRQLQQRVNTAFALRNCSAIYKLGG